jgi:hypothetical protein
VLFPEIDSFADIPEITEACWSLLGVDPRNIMCVTSRMVVKRKGAAAPVVACTLIVYDPRFAIGTSSGNADARVALNHPNCVRSVCSAAPAAAGEARRFTLVSKLSVRVDQEVSATA